MVDFQSRNTRRTFGGDSDEESDDDDATADDDADSRPEAEGVRQSRDVESDPVEGGVSYAVATVADGRTLDDDPSGEGVVEAIDAAGDGVATRELLAPSYDGVQAAVDALVGRGDVEAVVTVGGTGVEPTDVTVDAVQDLFDKRLPGFGELFRVLSHDHVGTAVVRTRATGGVIDGVPVFCLPGDPAAARRGVEEIVLAEAGELAAQSGDATEED